MNWIGGLQKRIVEAAPYWIKSGNGGAFLQALGLVLDTAQATLVHAVRQTRPLACFEDALPFIGADRGIRRYPHEPVQSYRVRLARWRQILRHYGSCYGSMINVQPYFLPGATPRIRIVHQAGDGLTAAWHTLNPDGSYELHHQTPSNWNWDQHFTRWSRFWVIIYVDAAIGPPPSTWDGFTTWDGSAIWDGYLSDAQIRDVLAMVNESAAPWSMCAGIILATDPDSFDPAGAWAFEAGFTSRTTYPAGDWDRAVHGPTNTPRRLSTAIFAYENPDL